jgi:hypothetical protein
MYFPYEVYNDNSLQLNREYIVFLENLYLDYNGTNSFYTYRPFSSYNREGGIFPINSDGYVQIPSNYFGYGTSVPLTAFKNYLQVDIESIISH